MSDPKKRKLVGGAVLFLLFSFFFLILILSLSLSLFFILLGYSEMKERRKSSLVARKTKKTKGSGIVSERRKQATQPFSGG